MKNTLLLLAAFFMLFVNSCKKEDDPGTNNNQNNNNQNNNNNNNNNNTPTHVNWVKRSLFIAYAADGVTELQRQVATYDSEGRLTNTKSYTYGNLTQENRNYTYNGNECEYYIDNYTSGSITSTSKFKIVNQNDWLDLSSVISYGPDGVTETYKQVSAYDTDGRRTGLTVWQNGVLSSISRDYTYNGNEQVFYSDSYSNGSVSNTTKIKMGNYKAWIRSSYYVQYKPDGVTEGYRTESTYDASERLIDIKTYINGTLSNENKDYTYNGTEVTYNSYAYNNGNVVSTTKIKEAYFNL